MSYRPKKLYSAKDALPDTYIAQTISRTVAGGNLSSLISGYLQLTSVQLRAGWQVTGVAAWSGNTPAGTPTHQWGVLVDEDLIVQAVSADDTSNAWAAHSEKQFTWTAKEVDRTGLWYVGVMVTATTVPTLLGATAGTTNATSTVEDLDPDPQGLVSSGWTTAPSVLDDLAAPMNFNRIQRPYYGILGSI